MLEDYADNTSNTSTLAECHLRSQDLFQKFTDFKSLEGFACSMYAATLHLTTLKSISEHDNGGLKTLHKRGTELSIWAEGAAQEVYAIYANSMGSRVSLTDYIVKKRNGPLNKEQYFLETTNCYYADVFKNDFIYFNGDIEINLEKDDPRWHEKEVIEKYKPLLRKQADDWFNSIYRERLNEGEKIKNSMIQIAENWKKL